MNAVKFQFQLDWKFASSGQTCVLRFDRDTGEHAKLQLMRWGIINRYCTIAEARDAMDLVDAVLDGAVDVFEATGQ